MFFHSCCPSVSPPLFFPPSPGPAPTWQTHFSWVWASTLTQQKISFLGSAPTPPSRISHSSRRKGGKISPTASELAKCLPLNLPTLPSTAQLGTLPSTPSLPPLLLAHQTQAEALIFFAPSCSQLVCALCGLRLNYSLPTSHCHVASQQPCCATALTAPRHYNLASQGISCRKREGAVHKPTTPSCPSSHGSDQSSIPGWKAQKSVRCMRLGGPVNRASVQVTGALLLLVLAKNTKHKKITSSIPSHKWVSLSLLLLYI